MLSRDKCQVIVEVILIPMLAALITAVASHPMCFNRPEMTKRFIITQSTSSRHYQCSEALWNTRRRPKGNEPR